MTFTRTQRIEHIRNLMEFTFARDLLNQKGHARVN